MTLWSSHGQLWRGVSAKWHNVCHAAMHWMEFAVLPVFFCWMRILYTQAKKRRLLKKPVCKLPIGLFFQLHKDALAGEWPWTADQRGKQQEKGETEFLFFGCWQRPRYGNDGYSKALHSWTRYQWVRPQTAAVNSTPLAQWGGTVAGNLKHMQTI